MARTYEALKQEVEYELDRATREILKFASDLSTEVRPQSKMRWSMVAFEAAARHEVYHLVNLTIVEGEAEKQAPEAIVAEVVKMALRNVTQAARSPQRSTSPVSNLAAQEEASAWARVLEAFERVAK